MITSTSSQDRHASPQEALFDPVVDDQPLLPFGGIDILPVAEDEVDELSSALESVTITSRAPMMANRAMRVLTPSCDEVAVLSGVALMTLAVMPLWDLTSTGQPTLLCFWGACALLRRLSR